MKIGILGAGISGLSLAYFLRKKWPDAEITLIEKGDRAGGVLHSTEVADFFFATGPSIFYTKRCHALLELINELNLASQVLGYGPPFFRRYIWLDEHMQVLSFNPFSLFYSSLSRSLYRGLFQEMLKPRNTADESVFEFGMRRFGKGPTEKILEPVVSAAHGGDIRNLSAWTLLHHYKEVERDYGSILRSLRLKRDKGPSCPIRGIEQSDLFTLKGGMSKIVDPLLAAANVNLRLKTSVQKILPNGGVVTDQGEMQFDRLFSTLPLPALSSCIEHPEMSAFTADAPMIGLIKVYLGYENLNLKKKGYGYLVPALERDDCLNATFDSELFPQQSSNKGQTRISYTLGGSAHPEFFELSDDEILIRVFGATFRHLKIREKPKVAIVKRYPRALIEYPVGYADKLQRLQQEVGQAYPQLTLAGSILGRSSISGLIESSARSASDA